MARKSAHAFIVGNWQSSLLVDRNALLLNGNSYMRKGRSSRRSRISRPLVSVKGEALSTDIGPASSGGLPSPRVVVGVPPSDPPPSESFETPPPVVMEAKAPANTRSIAAVLRGIDRDADLPPPPSEPPVDEVPTTGWTAPPPAVEEAKAEEPVAAAPIIEAPVVAAPVVEEAKVVDAAAPIAAAPEPEPVKLEKQLDLTATVVHGSSEAEKVEAKPEPSPEPAPEPVKPTFAKTLAFGSKLNELPQSERVEAAPAPIESAASRGRRDPSLGFDRLKEKRAQAQEAQKLISPKEDPDEISVPPANDINVEDEQFFSQADVAVRKSVHEFEMMAQQEAEELVPEKARRKLDPHVIRRRERFAGYVKIAVAGAAIVCLAAVGRSAIHSRNAKSAQAAQAAIAMAPETPPPAPVQPVAQKAAEPAAAPVQEAKEEAKPAEPVAEAKPSSDRVEEAKPAEVAAPTKAEEIAGDAKEELKKSRTALEKRKIPEAIEAGERSVALDPTDGEAWLILGAAYQEKGDMVNARRCYGACVKQGKTGPRLECQKMLRF